MKNKQNLLELIETKKGELSKGQKRIAEYISKNYDKAAYMTASKLGKLVGVSESTVVRFAIEMGFEGYPEMQRSLQGLIRMRLTSVQRVDITNSRIGDGDILDKVLLSDAEKIRATIDSIDRDAFNAAVDAVIQAKNIYIVGVRSSSMLAGFLDYHFQMVFDNVRFIRTASGSEMFEQIINVGKGDVLIAVSFPRYSKRVINAVDYAHDAGADVVAVTDSAGSPIASRADQLLTASSDMASFVDSLVAPLSVINAMIVAVSRKRPDEVRRRLEKLEKIWDEYDVYEKTES